jgi:dTDP-alpha-D-glucuronic acid decarboxylase
MGRYIILGGAGFVGANLAKKLVEAKASVVIVDNITYTQQENLAYLRALGCDVVQGDVRDIDFIRHVIDSSFDGVFHLASLVGIKNYLADPMSLIDINILGSRNVAQVCNERDIRLLFTSTSEVLGRNQHVPWKESADRVYGAPTVDRWAYGTSKGVAEQLLNAMHRQKGLKSIIIRFFNVYGPFQRPYFVVSKTLQHYLKSEPPLQYDTGRQTRCFTYIDDAVEAVVQLMQAPASVGNTYHIGSQFEHTVSDVIRITGEVCGSTLSPRVFDTKSEYGTVYEDIERRVPDVSAISEAIGWQAVTSYREGIERFRDWAKANPWWINLRI